MRSGVRIVALGGGTGLASLLLAVKDLPLEHLTAVVTVTDDGGSTGRLRREFDIPAVGDVRNCLVALAEHDELLARLFAHRFAGGGELGGHSLGNLFLAALLEITGDLTLAVRLSGEVLKVRGAILPSTPANVQLAGTSAAGERLAGERAVTAAGPPATVQLEPAGPPAVPEAVAALDAAGLILLGPGSLFTSLIPNLLVPGIAAAVARRRGPLVLVANLMTQASETLGMSLERHLEALLSHAPEARPDVVLVNSRAPSEAARARYAADGAEPILADEHTIWTGPGRLLARPLLAETPAGYVRHDRGALTAAVGDLLAELP